MDRWIQSDLCHTKIQFISVELSFKLVLNIMIIMSIFKYQEKNGGDEGGFQLTIQFPPLPSSQSVGITGNETPNNRLI